MSLVPTIETPRLRLRDWCDGDVEAWVAMNANPRVTEFFARKYTREISVSRAQMIRDELAKNGYGWWAVEVRGGPSFAGVICLRDVPFEAPFTPAREIGWRFSVENWGRGYATEAARAALEHAFDSLKWPEVIAITAAANVRSQRVMQRLGMTHAVADDFEHPEIERGHRLRPHVLYRYRSSSMGA